MPVDGAQELEKATDDDLPCHKLVTLNLGFRLETLSNTKFASCPRVSKGQIRDCWPPATDTLVAEALHLKAVAVDLNATRLPHPAVQKSI